MAKRENKVEFDTSSVIGALTQWIQKRGRGARAEASRLSGLSDTAIKNITEGKVERVSPKTWDALYDGIGPPIPVPPWRVRQQADKVPPPQDTTGVQISLIPYARPEDQATIIEGEYWEVPIFDAGMGEPCSFSDGGYPVGNASDYRSLPKKLIDENSFIVRCHGDSMEPTLYEGDLVVIVPSRPLINGKLCFATKIDEEFGERLIKRYRQSGDTIILESDNKNHDPIILNESNGKNWRKFKVTAIYNENV